MIRLVTAPHDEFGTGCGTVWGSQAGLTQGVVARYGGRLMITDGKANHGRPDGAAPWLGRLVHAGPACGLWFLELLDQLSGNQLTSTAFMREVDGMPEILTAPLPARWLGPPDQQFAAVLGAGFLVLLSGSPDGWSRR